MTTEPNNLPLIIVAAIGRNGVIGLKQGLPWNLPGDRRHFRERTWGKPLLMGRKTFNSIGRALPGRETIVLTRDRTFAAPGVWVAHDLEEALGLMQSRAAAMGASHGALAGGAELFRTLLPKVTRLELTWVDSFAEGDTFFPAIDWSQWVEENRSGPHQDPNDEASYFFADYRRKAGTEAMIDT